MRSSLAKNEKGSVLLLVLGLLVFVSIFCISFSNSIVNLQKNVSYSNHKFSRQFNINQTLTLLKTPNGLTESSGLSLNSGLAGCLFGPTCDAGTEQGFYFVDPSDTTLDVNLKGRLIGPPSAPVWYNANNTFCPVQSPSTNDCTYSLSGTYKAICPGNTSTCHHAEHLILKVRIVANPNSKAKNQNIRDKDFPTMIYFNNINYPPQINPPPDITLSLASGAETEVTITGDPGHPSEFQNFIFTKCLSSAASIVQITTPPDTPFYSGTAKIKLKPVALGTAKIMLQINDGGLENNLSQEISFNATVIP